MMDYENFPKQRKLIKKTKSVSSLQSAASRKASMSHLRAKGSVDMNSQMLLLAARELG
jgi:hypothetical protein